MPGLVRGIARTAVVAGTATATRNAVNRRQAEKNVQAYSDAAEHVQADHATEAPPPPPPQEEDVLSQLERLGALHAQGVLTDEEFAAQKAKLLSL
jgi:hypothetical protein